MGLVTRPFPPSALASGTPSTGKAPLSNDAGTTSTWTVVTGTASGVTGGASVKTFDFSAYFPIVLAQNQVLPIWFSGTNASTLISSEAKYSVSGATGQTHTISYTTANESAGYFTQEDATNGTDFVGSTGRLHTATPTRTILLHFEGSDTSTTITDNGANGAFHTWTCVGNAQIDTAQSKFDLASLLFDGTGDRLQLTATTDMSFTGDFTISMWIRPRVVTGIHVLMVPTDTSNNFQLAFYSDGRIDFYQGSTQVCTSSAGAITAGSWQHVALTRTGSTCKIWVGGVEKASGTRSGTLGRSDSNFNFGMYADGSYPFDGHLEELAVDTTCLYTDTFTPPSSAWANAAYPTTTTGYYLKTVTNLSSIGTSGIAKFTAWTGTQSEPTGTSIRYLLSWDGSTYKDHNGNTVALADIMTSGSTNAQMNTYFAGGGSGLVPPSEGSLDVVAGLKTTDATVTPTLTSIVLTYDQKAKHRETKLTGTDYQFDVVPSANGTMGYFTSLRSGSTTWYLKFNQN